MAISFIGSASGINTATMPTHQAGDLIVGWGFRDGSNSTPVVPAGWTTLETVTSNSAGSALSYKIAASSSETVGTWTNATTVQIMVYRGNGVLSVGDSAIATNIGTIISYPALTLLTTDGSSWVVGVAAHRSVNTTLETPPTGMINRISVIDATDETAGHDTNSGVSAWSLQTVSVGGTSSGWSGATVELCEASGSITVIPITVNLITNSFIPTILLPISAVPGIVSLSTTAFSPNITISNHITIDPAVVALNISTFGPSLIVTDNVVIAPPRASLILSGISPTVAASNDIVVSTGMVVLLINLFSPTATISNDRTVSPLAANLIVESFASIITISDNKVIIPSTVVVPINTFEPDVVYTNDQVAVPSTLYLTFSLFAPILAVTDHVTVMPEAISLQLTSIPPTVNISNTSQSDFLIMF